MITTFFEFFALWGLGFWILFAIVNASIVACLENERRVLPFLFGLGFFAIYWRDITSFEWNIKAVGVCLGVYVIIGIFWSLYRWHRYTRDQVDEFNQQREKAYRSGDKEKDAKEHQVMVKEFAYKLRPSEHKARLTSWIGYWPWSMFWNLLGDFFNSLYDTFASWYQKITDNSLSRIK